MTEDTTLPGTANTTETPKWSRYKYPESLYKHGTLLLILLFLGYSLHFLNVDIALLFGALGRFAGVVSERYYPPDLEYVLDWGYVGSILDTLQMSIPRRLCRCLPGHSAGLVLGLERVASAPYPVPRLARLGVISCRAIHETIWTILFVSVLGFGMLAGVSALTMFCIGFAGKLFADEIEAIEMGPVEAMRAAGANPFQVFIYAVVPQVRVAFTGIAIYTWDVAFRAATVVGFFGGGGMGWYLKRNVQQLENLRVAAIILSIIVMVLIAEFLSGWLRSAVNKAK